VAASVSLWIAEANADRPTQTPKPNIVPFKWVDALLMEGMLTEEERAIRNAAHAYCQEKLFPRVLMANRHERFDREIMNEMGEMGFLGVRTTGRESGLVPRYDALEFYAQLAAEGRFAVPVARTFSIEEWRP